MKACINVLKVFYIIQQFGLFIYSLFMLCFSWFAVLDVCRRFDAELGKVTEALRQEKSQRERLQRERDELTAQKYSLELEIKVRQFVSEVPSMPTPQNHDQYNYILETNW